MTFGAPLYYEWTGDGMRPVGRLLNQARRVFQIGQVYRLEISEERSESSHRHYFAAVREAWMQLPEDKSLQYPSEDHLRRWALIATGWHHERNIECKTPEEAARIAAIVKPLDNYAVILQRENVVRIYTAKSQSRKNMNKEDFQKSSEAVLDKLSQVIGVRQSQLEKEAARSPNLERN
jgi:hypothetical protein